MMTCLPMDVSCLAGTISGAVSQGVFKQFEEWCAQGAAATIRLTVTGWLTISTPDVDADNGAAAYLAAYTRPIAYAICAIALMFQAAQLAWSQRGEDLRDLARSIVSFVVVTGIGAASVTLLTQAGDSYTNWILQASTDGAAGKTMGERIIGLLGLAGLAAGSGLSVAGPVAAILSIMVMIAGLIQIILVYVRLIILILLVGLLPVAAAAALTKRGREILNRYVGWGISWVLFKPVAATIFAGAFWMMGTGGAMSFVAGMGCIGMAVFALPALMRLINPMVAGFGSGGGAEAALALGGVAASGAIKAGGSLASSAADDKSTGSSAMKVQDASHGSPSGAQAPGSGAAAAQGSQPTNAVGGAEAAGAAGGAEAAGAAGGPWGLAAVEGAKAVGAVGTAPAKGAKWAGNNATGSE